MRKLYALLISMLFAMTLVAQEAETSFGLTYTNPGDGASASKVEYIQLLFTKEVSVTLPEEAIIIKNNDTNVEYKIANGFAAGPNAVFYVEKVGDTNVRSISAIDDDGNINNDALGTYSFTIPAGCITSVDGEAFEGKTFTFSIKAPLSIVSYTPNTGVRELSTIELTFSEEIANVNTSSMNVVDFYYSNWYNITGATIGDDKRIVTLQLEQPITTIDKYTLIVYGGAFTSVSGSTNTEAYIDMEVIDPTPSFSLNITDGEKVQELSSTIEITFKNVNEVALVDGAEDVVVYLPGGGEAYGIVALENNKITVTFDEEFTEEGDYTFVIPEALFTMDGVENEGRDAFVTLYTFTITPLEIVSVAPVPGTVNQLDKIIVEYNQQVRLAYDENWQMISPQIKMSDGTNEYILTYNSMANSGSTIEYLVNAEWTGYEYATTPITTAGTYTINVGDIVVEYAAEKYIDEWGWENTMYHGKGSCEGTYSWIIDPVIPAGLLGDINGDGEVNVGDFAALVNVIFASDVDEAQQARADINEDGEVNVGDFAALVNVIFGGSSNAAPKKAAATRATTGEHRLYIEPFNIAPGERAEIAVLMENTGDKFSQMQFDLTLPEGISIVQEFDEELFGDVPLIKHGSRTSSKAYDITCRPEGDGVKIMCATENINAYFLRESGDVLLITVEAAADLAFGTYELTMSNSVLARQDDSTYKPASETAEITVCDLTGIDSIEAEEGAAEIYDIYGRRVDTLVKGVYIVNGKKVVK